MTAEIIKFTLNDEPLKATCDFCKKSFNSKFTKVVKGDSGKSACEHCIRRMKKLMDLPAE